jgi:hypothetical protein
LSFMWLFSCQTSLSGQLVVCRQVLSGPESLKRNQRACWGDFGIEGQK